MYLPFLYLMDRCGNRASVHNVLDKNRTEHALGMWEIYFAHLHQQPSRALTVNDICVYANRHGNDLENNTVSSSRKIVGLDVAEFKNDFVGTIIRDEFLNAEALVP